MHAVSLESIEFSNLIPDSDHEFVAFMDDIITYLIDNDGLSSVFLYRNTNSFDMPCF
jgi:hypothetical protein